MMTYPIANIFRSLQGEGHFVGYPCVFVRFAGCSVTECSIRVECDEAPWKATETLDVPGIVSRVASLAGSGIVVLTGGEPTDHDLLPLITALRENSYRIHLETSGARSVAGWPLEWLTVSPKAVGFVQRSGHTLKLVVRPEWTWPSIARLDTGTDFFHRYLQPLTLNGGPTHLEQVIELLMSPANRDGRWALSSQAHRYWGLA